MSVPNMMDTPEEIAALEAALLSVIVGYEERTGRRIKTLQVLSEGLIRTTSIDATWMTIKPITM